MPTTPLMALLRGVNVGGQRPVPMALLREVGGSVGLHNPRTYVQSGNLVGEAALSPAALEAALREALAARLGFAVDLTVRTGAAWSRLIAACPFADAAAARPTQLHLCLCAAAPTEGAVAALQARAQAGERVALGDGALYIDYAGGVGTSKLTPQALDRAAGCMVTARNWRTVLALAAMVEGAAAPG